MLDPLTALSLASPVLEIVRFSNFLSSRVCDLRSIGVVNYVNDIKIQVHDVGRTLTRIARLITDGTSDDGANEEKQRLTALCSQCREVGKKVAEHLEDVIASLPSQHSGPVAEKTNESRAAVKVKVNYATIEEYLKELKHLLAITSSQITASLRQSTTERFETTSLKHDMLQSGLSTILRLLENGGADIKEADFAEDGPVQQCMDISIQSELDSLHHIATVPYSLALTNTLIRRRTILSLINFRQMSDRIDEVDIAYKKTLEWIFQDKEYRLAWSSFPDFLRSASDPPYWINGKAGSGKSTLLRFLIRHKKALEHLRTWSGTRLLETAHFFAWNLGTTLQRTQMGLLQSLIYQVLVRDERLIHQVFPDLWHAIDPSQPKKHEPLSFAEAKRAFRRLIDLSAAKRCFCFFVDGIDEFEEDHNHVADLILGFQAPNLKFVLSSRPVDVCLDKFAGCPQLRLQDLTASDIETYIDGRLSSYHVMLDLMHEEPEATLELVHEVKERASGVFLWVKLVVTSLLTGLRKGDGIADLKVRLRALPPDLSKLFASMLGKMDPRYQKQAATLFRLVRTASMLLDGQGMPTQFLALAHHDFRSVLNHKPIAFETKKIMHWCRILERQLVSRCCGLVEFSRSSYKPDWWRADLNKLEEEDQVLLASQVQFLHRTVAEYLYQDEVWDKVVCKSSTNSRFNPHENLAYAALHMMKVSPLADDISSMQAYHWAKVLVQGVREFERREQTPLEDLVDEMDLVLRYHASYLSHWSSKIELYPAKNTVISHLTVLQRPLSNLLSFAAFVGLGAYVDSKLEQHGLVLGTGNSAQKVMLQTLFSRSDDWIKIELIDRVDAVCCLLEHGANPNETFEGPSFWQCCLQELSTVNCSKTISTTKTSAHRRRSNRRISSNSSLSRGESPQCTCSPQDFKDWCQLIVACLNAGAKFADIDYLAHSLQNSQEAPACCFGRLCQTLYGAKSEGDSTSLSVPETFAIPNKSYATAYEECNRSSYGSTSISGSAKAHLGDEHTYGNKITYVHHNYFGMGQTASNNNEVQPTPLLAERGSISTVASNDLTPHLDNDLADTLAQFKRDIVAALHAPSSIRANPDKLASTSTDLTQEEQRFVERWHWRGNVNTFKDRQCSNSNCLTNTTSGWDYVPFFKGPLCLDCYQWWRATGELRAEARGGELMFTGEELFDQSFAGMSQVTTSNDLDDTDEETLYEDVPSTMPKNYTQSSSVDSDAHETFATPQSLSISIKNFAFSAHQDPHSITSGTPHYLRNYKSSYG